MEQWKQDSDRYTTELEEAERLSETELHPLEEELAKTDEQISEQLLKINSMKAQIARHDARIQELLRMVVNVYDNK